MNLRAKLKELILGPDLERGKRHTLKCWRESFQSVWDGVKTFEYRKNDRDYQVGDSLMINEILPYVEYADGSPHYTGRAVGATIVHILHGPDFGVPEGYCVLGIHVWQRIHDVNDPIYLPLGLPTL